MMNVNLDKFTDKGQYKVPEGYFDTLADRIMANIPETTKQEEKKKSAKIISLNTRVKIAVAAAIAGALISSVTIRLYQQETKLAEVNTKTEMTNNSETYGEEYVNDYLDYAMVDEDDIYKYLSEN
ncbi:MAG: hypothetical protein IKO58_02700 [Prevotella sp.]|nr:hypothetical protein [Prevotella sp.]